MANRCLLLIFFLMMTFPGGCVPPDRRPVFQPDFHDSVPENPWPPPGTAETYRFRTEDLPSVDIPASEEIPLNLSVEKAVLLALQYNRELAVEQLTPVITGTFEAIERGIFDPELFGEAEYFEEESVETARSTGTRFSVEGRETAAALGIRQRLPTGTTLETAVEQERSISNRAPEQQIARFGLTVTQALLQGFGPAVNLAGVRQAELETLADVYELRGLTEALLAETEKAYWNYVLANREIAIFEESLAVARQQLQEAETRISVGVLPEIEAAAARAQVALHLQALIDARSRLADSRLRLLRLVNPPELGLAPNRELNAVSDLELDLRPIADTADRLRLAVDSRPDLGEARLRLTQNRLETIVTRNGLLPRLDFFAALGRTGYADTFSDSFTELDGDTYDITAGVRLNHYLINRAAKARDLAARVSVQQADAAVANLEQLVRLDVRLAVNEAERARQQITASAATRDLQEETLRAETERFGVGAGTGLSVAQSQRDLLQSQIAEVEAMVQYRLALVDLYLAEGSLLERRGIRLPTGSTPRK